MSSASPERPTPDLSEPWETLRPGEPILGTVDRVVATVCQLDHEERERYALYLEKTAMILRDKDLGNEVRRVTVRGTN